MQSNAMGVTEKKSSVERKKTHQSFQLVKVHWLEMSRNRSTFIFVLLFPFMMLGLFVLLAHVLESAGDAPVDFTVIAVPLGLCIAITGTTMTVTAGPIADYRNRGTLRILGTTPISRLSFLLTHMFVRFLLSVFLVACLSIFSFLLGVIDMASVGRILLASLPLIVLFLGIGYFVGSVMKTGQGATNVATAIQLLVLFTSGLAFPFTLLTGTVKKIVDFFPTVYLGDLLFWASGSPLRNYSVWLDLVVASVCIVVAVSLAVLTFRWDTRES